MALIRNLIAGGVNEKYLSDLSVTGTVNLRASHTIMCRMKHSVTTTSGDIWPVYFSDSTGASGSLIGRSASASPGSTTISAERGSTGGTINKADATGTYGNTTTWYHHTLVYDATAATISHYVDGTFISSVASVTTLPANVNGNFVVGILRGKLADVAFFSRALTAGEVSSMASYRVPQVTSGLIGFYRLDSGPADTSGQGNTLADAGSGTATAYSTADNPPQPETPTVALDGDAASSSALAGKLTSLVAGAAASSSAFAGQARALVKGNAASTSAFAGALRAAVKGDAASASALAAYLRPRWSRRFSPTTESSNTALTVPGSQPFTVMGWMKAVSWTSGDNFGGYLTDGGSNSVSWGIDSTSGQYFIQTGASVVLGTDDGNWHHYAIVWDGVAVTRYRDGSGTTTADTVANVNYGTILVGRSVAGTNTIEVSQLKLWAGRALTAAEVDSERLFHNPHVAPVSYWWQFTWQNPTQDDGGSSKTLSSGGAEAQFEPPGQFLGLITGAAASTSTFAGSLSTTKPIAGAAASSSAFAAAARALLTGPAASTSTLAGQLNALLSGSAASTSVFAGALSAQIAGAAASSSSLAGALQALLAGAAASSSSFSGTLGLSGQFAGNLTTASAFNTPQLSVNAPISGSLATSSALSGALRALLTGNAASASALSGKLSALLTGTTLATSSAFQGTLTASIAGNASSASLLAGALRQVMALQGNLLASSSLFSGTLSQATQVFPTGGAASSSLFVGSLSVNQIASATGNTYTGASVDNVFYTVNPPANRPNRQWPPRPRQ